jgi:hypothetical protein
MWKGLNVAVKTITFQDRVAGGEKAQHRAILEAAISSSLAHVSREGAGGRVPGLGSGSAFCRRMMPYQILARQACILSLLVWRGYQKAS